MNMIGLALCRHNNSGQGYLFQMPKYENLKEGDRVIVDTQKGEQEAVIVESATVCEDDSEIQMIIKAAGATLPLRRVLRKIVYKEFEYEEDE